MLNVKFRRPIVIDYNDLYTFPRIFFYDYTATQDKDESKLATHRRKRYKISSIYVQPFKIKVGVTEC